MAKKDSSPAEGSNTSRSTPGSQKKGRPTRTRREAEAARRQPLVEQDRKLARQLERQKRSEAYARQQEALQTGDERYLPVRDKGKVRRFTRDYVDSRWTLSEFLLPLMLIFLAASVGMSLIGGTSSVAGQIMIGVTIGLYGFFFISLIEGALIWRGAKKEIEKKYPREEIPRGSWFYCYSRMVMVRRFRSPRPQVVRSAPFGTRGETKS